MLEWEVGDGGGWGIDRWDKSGNKRWAKERAWVGFGKKTEGRGKREMEGLGVGPGIRDEE